MDKELDWEKEWFAFWEKESRHTEQAWLTPDTHRIIRDFIRELLTAKEDALRRAVEGMRLEFPREAEYIEADQYNAAIDKILSFLTPKN